VYCLLGRGFLIVRVSKCSCAVGFCITTLYLKNVTTLIVNNFLYTLELILIILAHYITTLLATKRMYNFQPHLTNVASLSEKT